MVGLLTRPNAPAANAGGGHYQASAPRGSGGGGSGSGGNPSSPRWQLGAPVGQPGRGSPCRLSASSGFAASAYASGQAGVAPAVEGAAAAAVRRLVGDEASGLV